MHGSYLTGLLPGLMIVSFGLGAVFVAVATAANAGRTRRPGRRAAQRLAAGRRRALGLAVLSAIATARTSRVLAARAPLPAALTAGFHQALFAGSLFMAATAVIGLRASNTRGGPHPAEPSPAPGARPVAGNSRSLSRTGRVSRPAPPLRLPIDTTRPVQPFQRKSVSVNHGYLSRRECVFPGKYRSYPLK